MDSAAHQLARCTAYDGVKRLTQWTSGKASVSFGYDDLGNLAERDVAPATGAKTTLKYTSGSSKTKPTPGPGGTGSGGPHAVIKSPDGTFDYDATGDQLSAPGRTVGWTSFHLPQKVTTASATTRYEYDALKRRARKTNEGSGEVTTYGPLYERRARGDSASHFFSITDGSRIVAQVVWSDDGRGVTDKRRLYLHDDHLGSRHAVTAEDGSALDTALYDPFGARVDPDDPTKPYTMPAPTAVHVGFTGHEQEDDLALINMRGRIYDPKVGRFLSADPVIQQPLYGQSLNRYSYVLNNPTNLIDPTGFWGEDTGGGSGGANPLTLIPVLVGWAVNGFPTRGCGSCTPPAGYVPPPSYGPCRPATDKPPAVVPFTEAGTARVTSVAPVTVGAFMGIGMPTLGSGYKIAGADFNPYSGPNLVSGPGSYNNQFASMEAGPRAFKEGAALVASAAVMTSAFVGGAGLIRGAIGLGSSLLAGESALGSGWFAGELTLTESVFGVAGTGASWVAAGRYTIGAATAEGGWARRRSSGNTWRQPWRDSSRADSLSDKPNDLRPIRNWRPHFEENASTPSSRRR